MTEGNRKRKWLGSAALFLLLVAFPAVSYWYLNQGFSYGKKVFSQLEPKGHIDSLVFSPIQRDMRLEHFEDQCLLLVNQQRNDFQDNLDRIVRQFGSNPRFNLIYWSSCDSPSVRFKEEESTEAYICGSDQWTEMGAPMLLFDRKGFLRYRYSGAENDWEAMVKHLAYMVPKEPKTSLSVKRK